MKKYIFIIVAILIVTAVGIYFGNPKIFQGRISSDITKTEKYIVQKGFCIRPGEKTQSKEAKDLTGTETKTEDNSNGTPTTEKKEEEKPIIDPSKITRGDGSGNTVTYSTPPTEEKNDEKSKKGKPGIEVTWQDCGCKDSGKIKSETKDAKGNTVKQVICQFKSIPECLRSDSEYKCPEGTEPNYDKIYDFCKTTKGKQCFSAAPPKSDDTGFCNTYNKYLMALACKPKTGCEETYSLFWEGNLTGELMKKLKISKVEAEKEASKQIDNCIPGIIAPQGWEEWGK
ncbi:hypothetical protein HZC20_02295 [Candidatus Peregrinibacteria bacterium]|nr:hypothetical protein [Candidatus Peregrinibacteria bacterium]